MIKDPKTCKNSHLFGDVYICQLECVPCAALNKCALDTVENMVKAMQELANLMDDFPKETST